jgi:hypothetical protein
MFVITTTVFAATLDVNRVTQAKTNWSWAATCEMIGTYQNTDSNRTQWDVVKQIKGSNYPNVGGSVTDIKNGITYASMDLVTYTSGSTLSWSNHTSNIDNSNPIAMWIAWDNNGGAHAVVCAGTKTTSGTNYLYVIDPWEDTDSTWYGYEALKNGTTLLTGNGKYMQSFWKN